MSASIILVHEKHEIALEAKRRVSRIFVHPVGCVRVFDAYAVTCVLVEPECDKVSHHLPGSTMKIGKYEVKIFKMKNRKGFAAVCNDCLTEGATENEAYERMTKAMRRVTRRPK